MPRAPNALENARTELLQIGASIGEDFGPLICERAGVRLAKDLGLPEERYGEGVVALRCDSSG